MKNELIVIVLAILLSVVVTNIAFVFTKQILTNYWDNKTTTDTQALNSQFTAELEYLNDLKHQLNDR